MRIGCVCITCNRPQLLGRLIKCFERQDHQNRWLVIVDDLGQYDRQAGDRWQLYSEHTMFPTLGEKRNFATSLLPTDVEAVAVADDDDFFSPWWLSSLAAALERHEWVQPRHAIDYVGGERVVVETFSRRHPEQVAYHSCWAYWRELFLRHGGYPAINCGEDWELNRRWKAAGLVSGDIEGPPFYTYNRIYQGLRISELGAGHGPRLKMASDAPWIGTVPVWTDESDWQLPIPTKTLVRQF